jgi:DNA ligase-1
LAHRNDLVNEIARVTGKSPDTNIPSHLRTNLKLFFEMFEQMRVRKAAMASSAATTGDAKSVVTEQDMMHGREWDGTTDLRGWLLTEKYDGCRLYWDGAKAWTRSGREIALPAHWQMPAVALDCELWAGRGGYQITRNAINHGDWSDPRLRLVVFDFPGGSNRTEAGLGCFGYRDSKTPLELAESTVAISNDDVRARRELIQRAGGEGLMARHPELTYAPGRTKLLLKVL